MSLSVAQRIRKIRKKFDLSQKDLAEILIAHPQRISDIETGKVKNLKNDEIAILQDKFKINPLFILTGDGDISNNHNNTIVGVNNGNISINTSSFNHGQDIKEIIELLQFATPQYLSIIKEKLEEFKRMH